MASLCLRWRRVGQGSDDEAALGEARPSAAVVRELVGGDVPPDLRGFAAAAHLAESATAQDGLEVLLGATAQAWGDEGVLLVETLAELLLVTTSTLVVAAGTRDRKVAFPGGDLPGVMLARGVQRFLHRDRVRPGLRAVVAGDGAIGYAVARQLLDAGVEVAALADARSAAAAGSKVPPGSALQRRRGLRLPLPDSVRVLHLHAVKAAHGFGRLRGVTLTPADGRAAGSAPA